MSFTTADIERLEALLSAADGGPQLVAQFRSEFPGRSLTRCEVSDMGGDEPFKQFARVDMYLVDGRDHCWHITQDPAAATGIVIAKHKRTA